MNAAVEDVRRRERQALLGEYLFPEGVMGTVKVSPYSAIPSISVLTGTPSTLRAKHPLIIEPIAESEISQGFVQNCPSLQYRFLWLRPEDDNYLTKYKFFLKWCHGIDSMPGGYDVDHLFNRVRAADLGLAFVRMVLLGPGENRSHGAGYESSRTKGGIGRAGRERKIDEIMLMKLMGIRSPRKNTPLSAEMLSHIGRISALFGIPRTEIERNIREVMEVAAFRPQDGKD